jgi:type IV pilus assembly protein PilM
MPVVRFRLRKMVPFDIETAAVSYQTMAHKSGQVSVLVTVMPGDVLAEYEGLVRELEFEPGAVLPSTLAVAAGLGHDGSALLVNHSRFAVTTAVTQGDEMILHRTVDLSRDLPVDSDARAEEMAQAVITTLAWYEDTLHAAPQSIYYAGPGGAREAAQSRWFSFVEPAPPVVDVASASASALTSIPDGFSAGVMGALSQ